MKKIVCLLIAIHLTILSVADSWIQKTDIPILPIGIRSSTGFAAGGKCYIATGGPIVSRGKDLWEYDPISDSWTQKADFAGAGRENACGFALGNKGYIGLGRTDDCCYTDDFWEYDPTANIWSQKAIFAGGARAGAFAFSIGSKGYIGGGSKNSSFKQDFWEYDPFTDSWTQKSNYGGGKVSYLAAFALNGKGYAGTGYDVNITFRNDFWEFNPDMDQWTQKAEFPGGIRYGTIGMSLKGFGYFGLGGTFDTLFADLWQYQPITDTWLKMAAFPGEATSVGLSVTMEDKAFVGTGGLSGNQWWQYVPDCITPTGLSTTNVKSTSAKVTWAVEPLAQTYSVRYRKSGTLQWTKTTAQLNFKKLTGLSPDTQYDWAVKSVCDAVNHVSSDWSATQNFITKPLRLQEEETPNTTIGIYPNPFSASATISFYLQQDSYISVELFDLAGTRRLEILVDEYLQAGDYSIPLNREQLAAGVYFLKIEMNEESSIMKVVTL
ncbi:MAG: T9SS type A sorting domain-containing protein [Chitinophagales bacterium]|nr:T9SS type A sorting domain-containing protein [Chitinophagales bacterium]